MPISKSASNARLATMEGETNFNVSWLSGNYTWPTYVVLLVLFRVLEFYFFTPLIPSAVQWTLFHTAHGIVSGGARGETGGGGEGGGGPRRLQ
jgi:hypothetical protein